MRRWFFLLAAVVLASCGYPDSKGKQLWEFVEDQAAWNDSIVARLDNSGETKPIVIETLRGQDRRLCEMIEILDVEKKIPALDCETFPTGPGDQAGSPTPRNGRARREAARAVTEGTHGPRPLRPASAAYIEASE